MKSSKTIRHDRAWWKQINEAYESSGSLQAMFCARHEISVASLQYWRKRFRGESVGDLGSTQTLPVSTRLLPVQIIGGPRTEKASRERFSMEVCRGDWVIRICEGAELSYVGGVLRQVEGLVC